MRIIITACQLRTYLPIVTIEIKVIIEIVQIESISNLRETITNRMINSLDIQIRTKRLRILGMISKILRITKRVTRATNSQQEETKMKEEVSSISVQLPNKEMIDIIELMNKNIRVREIKEKIIDSIRCLKGNQENNSRMVLMEEDLKTNMKGTLNRLDMHQIITRNLKKIKKLSIL
jgi:hypothetical protein